MKKFNRNTSGATAIDYGLIAALIAVVIISAASTLGGSIATTFNTVASSMPSS